MYTNHPSIDLKYLDHVGARPRDARHLSVSTVQACDAMVLLLGFDLGSRTHDKLMAYTEAEYHAAVDDGMDILPYWLPPDATFTDRIQPRLDQPSATVQRWNIERQLNFRAEIKNNSARGRHLFSRVEQTLTSPAALARQIGIDLDEWLAKYAQPKRIPSSQSVFVDRRDEYQALKARILDQRVSVVTGPFGVGKSSLIELLSADPQVQVRYPEGLINLRVPRELLFSNSEPQDERSYVRLEQLLTESVSLGSRAVIWARIEMISGPAVSDELSRVSQSDAFYDFAARLFSRLVKAHNSTLAFVFEVTELPLRRALLHQLHLAPDKASVELSRLQPSDALTLFRQLGGVVDGCNTCDRLAQALVVAVDRTPVLVELSAGSARGAVDHDARHDLMRHWGAVLSSTSQADRAYTTVAAAIGTIQDGVERRLLTAAAILLPSPFPFLQEPIAEMVPGSGSGATVKRKLTHLVQRGFLHSANPTNQAPGTSRYLIHPLVALYVRRLAAVDEMTEMANMQDAAWSWFDTALNARLDEDSYEAWYHFESDEWQFLVFNWIHLLFARSSKEGLEGLIRLYLKAHWWWGYYIPFVFCDYLAAVGSHLASRDETPVAVDNAVSQVQVLHLAYPRLGEFRREPFRDGDAWKNVQIALEELARLLNIPPYDTDPHPKETLPLSETRRDIEELLHVFLAHCERFGRPARVFDSARIRRIAGHYRIAIRIASSPPRDNWNIAWFKYEAADFWAEVADVAGNESVRQTAANRSKRFCDQAWQSARRCAHWDTLTLISRLPENLDFEVLSLIERTRAQPVLQPVGDPGQHLARSIHYARCFQIWPSHGPDEYTTNLYEAHCWTASRLLEELAGSEEPQDRVLALAMVDTLTSFFEVDGAPARETLSLVASPSFSRQALIDQLFPCGPPPDDLRQQDDSARRSVERFHQETREAIQRAEARYPELIRLPGP